MSARKKNATKASAAEQHFDLLSSPGFLIRRCHARSREIFDELIGKNTGLSREQMAVLISIKQHPGANQAQLTEATLFDRNTLGEIIRRLVDKQLVERKQATHDKRAYEVSLTRAGTALMAVVYPLLAEVQEQILDHIPEKDRKTFLTCLKKISDSSLRSIKISE